MEQLIGAVRDRARVARRTAWLSILGLFLTSAGLAVFIYLGVENSLKAYLDRGLLEGWESRYIEQVTDQMDGRLRGEAIASPDKMRKAYDSNPQFAEVINGFLAERGQATHRAPQTFLDAMVLFDATAMRSSVGDVFGATAQSLMNRQPRALEFFASISQVAIRVGVVLVAFYFMSMVVSVARYHFRYADHLAAVADAMDAVGGNTASLVTLMPMIAPQHVDFGSSPRTPMENSVELVQALRGLVETTVRAERG